MEREKNIEKRLKSRVEAIGGLCKKHVSTGEAGEPDRLVSFNGRLTLVETKVKGGELSPIQRYVHKQYLKRGVKVWLVYDNLTLNLFINAIRTA